MRQAHCDLLVIGSGAAGFAAALTAKLLGLDVIMVEKERCFGGASARSGGGLWIPGNGVDAPNEADTRDSQRTYLRHVAQHAYDEERVDAFLRNGPEMLAFLTAHTHLRFDATPLPDYHSDAPGGSSGGRSIFARDFDGRLLGNRLNELQPMIRAGRFLGVSVGRNDMPRFLGAGRSVRDLAYLAARVAGASLDRIRFGRDTRLGNGNALIGRLAKSAFDLGIPLWTGAPARRLVVEAGRVCGAVVETCEGEVEVRSSRGVVLATGGFPHDADLRRLYMPALAEPLCWDVLPAANSGDGIALARSAGGAVNTNVLSPVALAPIAGFTERGEVLPFPYFSGRAKPGFIAVLPDGRRFANEADSYHDFGLALLRAYRGPGQPHAFVIGDQRAMRRYGHGFAKPFPMPSWLYRRAGYLVSAPTPEALGRKAGFDGAELAHTIAAYNDGAREGRDPAFGRGSSAYNRAQGDPDHQPNPCVAPLTVAPFHAVRVVPGAVGTFVGLRTDGHARVLDDGGRAVPGLYACGNDAATPLGGDYVGGGTTLGPAMTFGYVAARHASGQIVE